MIERCNPSTVYDTAKLGFPQILLVGGGRLMFANAVAFDQQYEVVGAGDFGVQMRQALANIRAMLDDVAAAPADICQMRINVVGMNDETRFQVRDALEEFYGPQERASNALIGIDRLARPDLLVEIEVIAAVN